MLTEMQLREFVQTTSSDSPTPGGGSVAALAGALAAALSSMVVRLTTGNRHFSELSTSDQKRLHNSLEVLTDLTQQLSDAVENDAASFDGVMTAFKMPKTTDEERSSRNQAIQNGYRAAAAVPIDTAAKCLQVLEASKVVAQHGNASAVSDAAVASLMARAGAMGALYNVRINMGSIKDENHVEALRTEVKRIDAATKNLSEEILGMCETRLERN